MTLSEMTTLTHSSPVKTLAAQQPLTNPTQTQVTHSIRTRGQLPLGYSIWGPILGTLYPEGIIPKLPVGKHLNLRSHTSQTRSWAEAPSLRWQLGTSGDRSGLSRDSLQHWRPLRRAARQREDWPVRASRVQGAANSGCVCGVGLSSGPDRYSGEGSLHHSRKPTREPTGGGGPGIAHGARAQHGRGAGGDTILPLPVSWAAPSRCCPSPYEAVGRWGPVRGGLRAGVA